MSGVFIYFPFIEMTLFSTGTGWSSWWTWLVALWHLRATNSASIILWRRSNWPICLSSTKSAQELCSSPPLPRFSFCNAEWSGYAVASVASFARCPSYHTILLGKISYCMGMYGRTYRCEVISASTGIERSVKSYRAVHAVLSPNGQPPHAFYHVWRTWRSRVILHFIHSATS